MVKMKDNEDAAAATIGVDPFPVDPCYCLPGSSTKPCPRGNIDPVISAVVKGQALQNIQDLISGGADVNVQDSHGKTALMHALAGRRDLSLGILTLLIGDIVNVQDKHGCSPLMYAVSYGADMMFIKTLLQKGAGVCLKDNVGRTALVLAVQGCPYKRFSNIKIAKNSWLRRLTELVDLTYPFMTVEMKVYVADYFVNRSGLTFRKLLEESEELLLWMLHKCIVPKAIVPKEALKEPAGCDSPLISAVILGNLDAVRHLVGVGCLTTRDFIFLAGLQRNKELRVTGDIRRFAIEVTSKPWSLQKLSILVVSTALGNGPDRIQRVGALELPTLLKKTLAYKKKI